MEDKNQTLVVVPRIPTIEQCDGLARAILSWWRLNNNTGSSLFLSLHAGGYKIPSWLEAVIPNIGSVPSSDTVIFCIYRAMIEEHSSPVTEKDGLVRGAQCALVPCDCGCGRSCCANCGVDLGFISKRGTK